MEVADPQFRGDRRRIRHGEEADAKRGIPLDRGDDVVDRGLFRGDIFTNPCTSDWREGIWWRPSNAASVSARLRIGTTSGTSAITSLRIGPRELLLTPGARLFSVASGPGFRARDLGRLWQRVPPTEVRASTGLRHSSKGEFRRSKSGKSK